MLTQMPIITSGMAKAMAKSTCAYINKIITAPLKKIDNVVDHHTNIALEYEILDDSGRHRIEHVVDAPVAHNLAAGKRKQAVPCNDCISNQYFQNSVNIDIARHDWEADTKVGAVPEVAQYIPHINKHYHANSSSLVTFMCMPLMMCILSRSGFLGSVAT